MRSNRIATAEWAEPALVAQNYQYENGEFWLGRAADDEATSLGYIDDRHICLVSGSRGGKGTSTIINNLCLYPGSVIVIDPKGENATVTAARRGDGSEHCEGMGQSVYVLDPFNTAQIEEKYKARFNPLDAIDPNSRNALDDAGRIADALIVMDPNNKDPFWEESARQLLKGIILHVITAAEFEGERNLITVRNLVTRGDWKAVQLLKESGEEHIASGQALLWEAIRHNPAFNGKLSGIGETIVGMLERSEKTFESVLQTANRNTEFIDSPDMEDCLLSSDFELSELKTNPKGMSLYLSLPQGDMNTHYRWLRMMISLTTRKMEAQKGQPVTGHRILMVLDEFAGLQRMKIIEDAVAQMAGFGVTMFFILQSLEQLKATYPDKWETFLANSGLKIFFNLEDYFSRDYVSKFIGETELIRETHSSSRSTSDNQSKSTSYSQSSSRSGGTSRSRNRSTGRSDGMSWKRKLFFFRVDKNYNEGSNQSRGISTGSNSGWASSTTRGSSETYGTSRSETEGTSESIHKRFLITPDEIGKFFGRINDVSHPAYPGLALVLVSGENPIAVRRSNYYQDEFFNKKFNPHPDYKETKYEYKILAPNNAFMDYVKKIDLELHLNKYSKVEKGEVLFSHTRNTKKRWSEELIKKYKDKPQTFKNNTLRKLEEFGILIDSYETLDNDLEILSPVSGEIIDYDGERYVVIETSKKEFDNSIEEKNLLAVKQAALEIRDKMQTAYYFFITILALCSLIFLMLVIVGIPTLLAGKPGNFLFIILAFFVGKYGVYGSFLMMRGAREAYLSYPKKA